MADSPSSDTKDKTSEMPTPEVLKPQSEEASPAPSETSTQPHKVVIPKRSHHGSYRPSHKATFIGLTVVVGILLINGGILYFVMRGQSDASAQANRDEVTLNSATLDKLGVSRNAVGDLGTELTIGPSTRFDGTVTIAGDTSIGGELKLNSKFSASDASLAKLQAGDTALNTLNVNGDTTTSNLTLRKDLSVTGLTRLQGAVTMSQILTVNNSVNIAGNLAIGGSLSVRNFQVSTLTIAGHLISTGLAPSVGVAGGAVGSSGTVSISGNDASGTIGVNVGAGAGAGCLATVTFKQTYTATPHVVVTGSTPANIYLSGRTASGFTVCTGSALPPGGYFIDYVVVQ